MNDKTLIELMLEANVEWPEGAEFAAQSSSDNRHELGFFSFKPTRIGGLWMHGEQRGRCWLIKKRASNWHQAIVTREQYEAAQGGAVNPDDVFDSEVKPLASHSSINASWGKTSKTIEQKIKDMVFHQESIARYREQIEANHAVVDKLRTEIAADLAALGWGERVAEPELVITDWRDLQAGDLIIFRGKDFRVTDIDHGRSHQVRLRDKNGEHDGIRGAAFNNYGEFIHRPS